MNDDQGPTFETGDLAISAALEGLGVVLMDWSLLENEGPAGQLVDLFPESQFVNNGYFFFCIGQNFFCSSHDQHSPVSEYDAAGLVHMASARRIHELIGPS